MKRVNHAGKYYGKLYVLKYDHTDKKNYWTYWKCLCECGRIVEFRLDVLKKAVSCGCSRKGRGWKHGMSGTGSHRSWLQMIARCNQPSSTGYKNYGGRGIKVCYRWRDFTAFYKDMGDRPDGGSLDRIDVNGNYCPENCRWATFKEQQNNRTNNRLVEVEGQIKTLQQWSDSTGLNCKTIETRLRKGWSDKRAVTTPVDTRYARNKQESVK